MNIQQIIKEEIDRYLIEDILPEKEEKAKKHSNNDVIRKHSVKTKGGGRSDYNETDANRADPVLTFGDTAYITNVLDNDVVNVAAFARKMYPNLTPQGAQSKLRKKIKHEKSDSGSVYKLRKHEVEKARKILDREL